MDNDLTDKEYTFDEQSIYETDNIVGQAIEDCLHHFHRFKNMWT